MQHIEAACQSIFPKFKGYYNLIQRQTFLLNYFHLIIQVVRVLSLVFEATNSVERWTRLKLGWWGWNQCPKVVFSVPPQSLFQWLPAPSVWLSDSLDHPHFPVQYLLSSARGTHYSRTWASKRLLHPITRTRSWSGLELTFYLRHLCPFALIIPFADVISLEFLFVLNTFVKRYLIKQPSLKNQRTTAV